MIAARSFKSRYPTLIALARLSRKVAMMSMLPIAILGCGGSPLAGNWNGDVKLNASPKTKSSAAYSETKVSLVSHLYLSGDGSYKAKMQEVDTTGDWTQQGQTVTLTPKTYMGMDLQHFPATKQATGPDVVNKLFQPYKLDLSADGKTMTHTDDKATTTYILGPA